MANTDYRVSFRGDIGNLQQFISTIGSGLGRGIRQMYMSQAAAPARSITSSSSSDLVGVRGISTSIDAYNRTITQSGQVFHKFVSGWVADIQRLDQAAARLNAKLGAGGAIYGTPGSLASGRIGIRMSDLKATYDEFLEAPYQATPQNLALVAKAQERLGTPKARSITTRGGQIITVPPTSYFQEVEQLDKVKRGLELRSQARVDSITTLADEKMAAIDTQMGNVGASLVKTISRTDKLIRSGVADVRQIMTGSTDVRGVPVGDWYERAYQRLGGAARWSDSGAMLMAGGWKAGTPTTSAGFAAAPQLTAQERAVRQQIIKALYEELGVTEAVVTGRRATAFAEQKINGLQQQQVVLEQETNTLLAAENARYQKTLGIAGRRQGTINQRWGQELAYKAYAEGAPAPVPTDLAYFLQSSKQFRKEFTKKMGITSPVLYKGGTQFTDTFMRDIQKMGITSSATHDFERGVTRLSGSVKALNGITGDYSWTLDNNGRIVETWGRRMRGIGGFLPQVARDFQKVVEWTIATTVVFGSLAAVFGSFTKINQVNADLQRFQITAKTTGEETEKAFKIISDVAVRTATPLTDLTAVMDDIALATRRVAQSSDEWMGSIENLAEAVGILTNITGLDTAKGTDMLTSAYKQLGMTTEELIPLLNKVSAVAGGNAQAIQDIMQALGGLAEAARGAGLNVDQQIGAVQTLSQVTNKTAADTATAFKNLFGAINSPASEKFLKSFGIAIRDATGNLRPFLDIYGEIYAKMQTGVIPVGRLQDLYRAIAGGPRRAPDAAALLSNYPKIMEGIGISTNATNEALIANAKILETNNAKLQQLRSQFDAALVDKFTDAVNRLVAAIITAGDFLSNIFGGIPDQLVSVILQVTILLSSFTLLRKGLSMIAPLFQNITRAMAGTASAASTVRTGVAGIQGSAATITSQGGLMLVPAATAAARTTSLRGIPVPPRWSGGTGLRMEGGIPSVFRTTTASNGALRDATTGRFISPNAVRSPINIVGRGPSTPYVRPPFQTVGRLEAQQLVLQNGASNTLMGTIGTGLTKNKMLVGGVLGLAAGAGAGILGGVLGGSSGIQTAATAAQGLGLPLMMIGGPVGIGAGLALTAVGTALQLIDSQGQQSAESMFKAKSAVYDLVQGMNEQVRTGDTARQMQEQNKLTMERLAAITNRTTEEELMLTQARKQYVASTFEMADARAALNEKEKELLDILPQLSKDYSIWIDALQKGSLTSEERSSLYSKISGDILGLKGIPYLENISDYFKMGQGKNTGIYGTYNNPDAMYKNLAETGLLIQDILRRPEEDRWKEVADILKRFGPEGSTPYGYGFQITQTFMSQVLAAFSSASEFEQGSEEFAATVDLFEKIVRENANPSDTILTQWAVAAYKTKTNLGALTGEFSGDLLKNMLSRGTLAGLLAAPGERGAYGVPKPGQRSGREFEATEARKADVTKFIEDMLGKTTELSYEEVKKAFDFWLNSGTDTARQLKTAFDNAGPDVLNDAIKKFIELNGEGKISAEGLGEAVLAILANEEELTAELTRQQEIKAGIRSNFESTAADLGKQLLDLQAAYQGGDIEYTQWKAQSKELEAYIKLNREFKNLMQNESEPVLEAFGDTLGQVTGLFGIQYQNVDQLTGAIIGWGQALGLSADQITAVMLKMVELNKAVALLYALKDIRVSVMVDVTTGKKRAGSTQSIGSQIQELRAEIEKLVGDIIGIGASGNPARYNPPSASGGGSSSYNKPGIIDVPDEWKNAGINIKDYLAKAIKWAKEYQAAIPGEAKANKDEVVAIMDENKRLMLQKGIGEEYLRKAMDNLTEEIKKQNDLLAKADTIRRIRVGAGDFAALANVPINKTSGISLGGPQGPITISLNITGQVLTPAQMEQLGNSIGAALGRQISSNG